jgi:hypothetical protein
MVGMAILLAVLASGVVACGGGAGTTSCNNTYVSGTTAGNYTVTVTGSSGATSATGTFTITVQ